MLFFCLHHSSKSDQGPATGFLRRHSLLHVFFNRKLQMRGHLRIEVAVERLLGEEGTHALPSLPQCIDHRSPPCLSMPRTRPITLASRCQYAASSASCFRPRLVIS